MKKNKPNAWSVDIDVFRETVHFIVPSTRNINLALEMVGNPYTADEIGGMCCEYDDEIYVFINPVCTSDILGTLVHETRHATDKIMSHIGQGRTYNYGASEFEVEAYIQQFLFTSVYKNYKKYTK